MRKWRKKQLRKDPVRYKLQAMVRRARARAIKKGVPCTLHWEELRDLVKDADALLDTLFEKFPEIHIDEPMNWPYR